MVGIYFLSCTESNRPVSSPISPMVLTQDVAESLIKLPLKCIQTEYPNKLNQSLHSSSELGTPSELHPAFYGCFDWHSAVHGHWLLVKLLNDFPTLSNTSEVKQLLSTQLSAKNILDEVAYFNRVSEKSFERTYGWAWVLQLDQVLFESKDSILTGLHANLQPLTTLIVQKYLEFLPRLNYPIRSGEHPNTAFGLALAYDYATVLGQDSLRLLIEKRAKDFYTNDQDCPLNWEPSGFDFLSPCFQEADLMSRILDSDAFKLWLDRFLPSLSKSDFDLEVAKVSDRSDGKLVHLDGVNFCRAWSMYNIVKKIPEYQHLIAVANKHVESSLPQIADGGYEGEHWLATFAIYALAHD